jgi:hypothetical protein
MKLISKKNFPFWKLCIDNTVEVVKHNRFILVVKGQGDGETRWKGWAWNIFLLETANIHMYMLFLFQSHKIKNYFYLNSYIRVELISRY